MGCCCVYSNEFVFNIKVFLINKGYNTEYITSTYHGALLFFVFELNQSLADLNWISSVSIRFWG